MPKPPGAKLLISHDSRTRLDSAVNWLHTFPRDAEVLIICPTREAGDEFIRCCVIGAGSSNVSPARFGLLRVTLERLAISLATPLLAASARAPITGLSLEALTARAVHSMTSKRGLTYFEPVAQRPGFPRAVARTLDELRMNAVDIEAVRRLPRGGPDLAALAEVIERELASAKLATRSVIFKAAIKAARGAEPVHPAGLPLLILDVAVSNKLEADLIEALATHAPSTLATAARGDTRTIEMLQRTLKCLVEEIAAKSSTSSLATLKAHLFETSKPRELAMDESVTLSSSPGEARECVEIARRIQAEAGSGTQFDRVAIFRRSPAEYRPHLEEAFRRAAIPYYF